MKDTANRAHHTIDIAPKQYRKTSARTERRKAERKAATAARKQRIRERIAANHRLVRA